MKIKSPAAIIKDAVSDFTQSNPKFWENDEELIKHINGLFIGRPIENGADMYSIVSAILVETSVNFKKIGVVPGELWMPILQSAESGVFLEIGDDYAFGIVKFRKKYKAPMPQSIISANDLFQKMQELRPLRKKMPASNSKALLTIREMASSYMKELLNLYDSMDINDNSTTYMTGIEAMEAYKQIVGDAFDCLIELSSAPETEVSNG